MANKSYQKGYRFERKVIKNLESLGYIVIRSGKSKFPDGVALRSTEIVLPKVFLFECKWNKYLSKEEKSQADTIKLKTNLPFIVFYHDIDEKDKRRTKIKWWEYE